jgi:hypothetical protein
MTVLAKSDLRKRPVHRIPAGGWGWRSGYPILLRNVLYYERLSPADQQDLQRIIQVFVAEKNFEGCGGLEITDEIKVTIAAYACILLLHVENHDYYPCLQSILVYPHSDSGVTEGYSHARLDELYAAIERLPHPDTCGHTASVRAGTDEQALDHLLDQNMVISGPRGAPNGTDKQTGNDTCHDQDERYNPCADTVLHSLALAGAGCSDEGDTGVDIRPSTQVD